MLGDRALTGIALGVFAVWGFLNVFDALSRAYDTPVMVHTIMGVVVGSLFGEKIKRRREPSRTLEELGLTEEDEHGR